MDPSAERRDTTISKALSKLLRHKAVEENLPIDNEGYIKIDDILKHQYLKSKKATREDIERIVANNAKQRFSIKDDKICANQGHSIKTVSDTNLVKLTRETIPSEVFHGTYMNKLSAIVQSGGLSKMQRNHIHFTSTSASLSNISGMRNSANCLIYLNIDKCLASGIEFYRSANDVILSSGNPDGIITVDLFDKVVDRKTGSVVDITKYKQQQ